MLVWRLKPLKVMVSISRVGSRGRLYQPNTPAPTSAGMAAMAMVMTVLFLGLGHLLPLSRITTVCRGCSGSSSPSKMILFASPFSSNTIFLGLPLCSNTILLVSASLPSCRRIVRLPLYAIFGPHNVKSISVTTPRNSAIRNQKCFLLTLVS